MTSLHTKISGKNGVLNECINRARVSRFVLPVASLTLATVIFPRYAISVAFIGNRDFSSLGF
jgi:hypothetical protein